MYEYLISMFAKHFLDFTSFRINSGNQPYEYKINLKLFCAIVVPRNHNYFIVL